MSKEVKYNMMGEEVRDFLTEKKELEGKILKFYNILKEHSKSGWHISSTEELEAAVWLNKFKEHFDIKESKEGKILPNYIAGIDPYDTNNNI